MQPDSGDRDPRSPSIVVLATLLWSLLFAICTIRVLLQEKPRATVYPVFAVAGRHWSAGEHLYRSEEHRFRYSPIVAAAFSPLAHLDDRLGDFLWRCCNVVVFVIGLREWFRSVRPDSKSERAWLWLFAMPLAFGSFGNGQANPLVLGTMLIATLAVRRSAWTLAAVCLAVATFVKLYPLALGLLLVVAFGWPLAWRLAVALAIGFWLPLTLQEPARAMAEYREWIHFLAADTRVDWEWIAANRDVWLLLRRLGVSLDFNLYRCATFAIGAGLAALVWACRCKTHSASAAPARERDIAAMALQCSAFWMVLFGPATESCTYLLLAPYFAETLLQWPEGAVAPRRRCLLATGITLLMAAEVANLFPWAASFHSFGPQPLGALLLFVDFVATTCAVDRGLLLTKCELRRLMLSGERRVAWTTAQGRQNAADSNEFGDWSR